MKTMIKYLCCAFVLSCIITHSSKPSGALEYARQMERVRQQEAKRQQEAAAKRAAEEARKRQEQARLTSGK